MASYQRVALFIFFDALERDLIEHLRRAAQFNEASILTEDEREKALQRQRSKSDGGDGSELFVYLDYGDKISILSRLKNGFEVGFQQHFERKYPSFEKTIPVRNATMHGRPLTTEEYALGFSFAQDLIQSPGYWPTLHSVYVAFARDPEKFLTASIEFIDGPVVSEVLNNLPIPDYDDTGFLPRNALQKEITKKIKSRHPVICILGDGGNGKTALALQTLYSMIESNDHDFDAIVWVSAKTNKLTTNEVVRIEGAITSSIGIFAEAANLLEPGDEDPITRVRRLLEENSVLLVIDNLETVLDDDVVAFVEDIPNKSKVLFTSRVPLEGSLSIQVPEFTSEEAVRYLRRLIDVYDVSELRTLNQKKLGTFAGRLNNKPLLLKWFAVGVSKGLDPNRIVANPEMALRFCLENVVDRLDGETISVLATMAAIPSAVSGPIVEHCGHLSSSQVESGLAALIRFGLIERVPNDSNERNYRIKPFVRAYILRAAKIVASNPQAVNARYRAIDSVYQEERGAQATSKYDGRFFTIRSKSEAVAAMRIKHGISLAMRGEYDRADKIFRDLLISSPDYFEVHRAMAFVAFRSGDTASAAGSYESAVELEPEIPQVRFFYGGFLMRALGDYKGAADQFDIALGADPDNSTVLREAARVQFFMANFERAGELIERAKRSSYKSLKEEIVVTDLEGQLYARHLEHLFKIGDPATAVEVATKFHNFLSKVNPAVIDEKAGVHFLKAVPYLEALMQSRFTDNSELIESAIRMIHDFATNARSGDLSEALLSSGESERFGYMKKEGRTDRFGFIRDTFRTDTYVARSSVGDVVWDDMCDGHPVKFNLIRDENGKTRAEKVVLVG
jgi:Tfp pilus assembly protein PilF